MLDKTLGYILCCQSPGLFLAAAVLVIAYFAGRKKHRFKAVLKLLLAIVCAVGGIALYYLGMYDEYFTIRDFYQIRPAGWVGVGIAAFFTLLALVRAFFAAADARREEKAANRAENQRRAAEAAAAEAAARESARQEQTQPAEAAPAADEPAADAPAVTPEMPPQEPEPEPAETPEEPAQTEAYKERCSRWEQRSFYVLSDSRSRRRAWAWDGPACR